MEMKSELPTDDASVELDGDGPRGDAKPSESLLTLKPTWSEMTLTGSSDLCSDAIHLDFLVEKGWIDYDSLDQKAVDETGDCSRCLTSASDLGGIAEIVNEMRNEFIGKLSTNVKGLKRILKKDNELRLRKGMTKPGEGQSVFREQGVEPKNVSDVELEVPEFMNDKETPKEELSTEDDNRVDDQLIGDIKEFASDVGRNPDSVDRNSELAAKIISEVELKIPNLMNDKESPEEELSTEVGHRDDEIIKLIGDINQFTTEVEKDPDSVDWSNFRSNLLKIHRHYVQNPETKSQFHVEVPSSDISVPVYDLKSQSKYLRRKVQSLESKILNLDETLEEFSENFRRSLVSKESVEHEMVTLSVMRDRIGHRLSELENEFRWARRQLFMAAKDEDKNKQRAHSFHN
ncbi:hypothetical protein KR200_005526 [Drosophila serrata]|nr:hypothetical protein KR200_005526 [Drosophila serrata]